MCKLLVVYNTVRSCDVYRPIIRDLICVNIRQYDASINIRKHSLCVFRITSKTLLCGTYYILVISLVADTQARSQDCQNEEADRSSALSPPFPYPPLPLEVGPLNPARVWGSAVSSPSGVWVGALAKIEFGAF